MGANITAKATAVMVGSNNTLKFMSTKDPCDIPNDFKTDTHVRSGEENEDLKSHVESGEAIDDDSKDGDLGSWNSSDLDSDEDVDENETDVLMVGKNTLDLYIGDYIQRRHDLGENTRVNIRHQRSQIQGKDGIQAGENMYIQITVNSYPSVERAVIQAYQHNEDFSSKLKRWFSDFLVILAGVDHGSIIIELKPESPESLERMLNAVKDGSFDDVILDMLREKSVFELIKGKEVTVDVQLETHPATTESIASSNPVIQIKLGTESVDDQHDIVTTDESPMLIEDRTHRIPGSQNPDRYRDTSKLKLKGCQAEKREVVEALRNLAKELDKKQRVRNIAEPYYAGLAIGGAVAFGASLGLAIVGVGIGVGIGAVATVIYDKVIIGNAIKEAEAAIARYNDTVDFVDLSEDIADMKKGLIDDQNAQKFPLALDPEYTLVTKVASDVKKTRAHPDQHHQNQPRQPFELATQIEEMVRYFEEKGIFSDNLLSGIANRLHQLKNI